MALQRQILCSKGGESEIWNSKLYGNKISVCAENVFDFYNRFKGKTQLVFCDIGTPKSELNVYDCLKNELCRLGIKEEEISFVHDATSEARRARLFESVNAGEIKVLIGSTFKLGTGVNVQEKLIAIHHLDVPWRPSDMVQRDGRLVRRGNTNEKVYIFRYVTVGSFDAYSWQILENKQRFITELLSGIAKGAGERRLDDAVLSYAEVKALAIGNPLIKTRVEICNELARLKTLEREENLKREDLENMKLTLPEEIEREKQRLLCVKADAVDYKYSSEIPDNRLIARLISKTISLNALNAQEIFIADFKNFKIVLPANFNKIRPYLILQANARYVLDIATFSSGAVTKIENFLSTLDKQAKELTERINELEMQFIQVKHELEKGDEYACKIAELTEKLNETDKTLGLEKTPVL